MSIDVLKIGEQIATLRKAKGITQAELGNRVNVSFQAVSKWERGEALPDVGILVELANVLETSVDNILTGGQKMLNYRGKIKVSDMKAGIMCLEEMGKTSRKR